MRRENLFSILFGLLFMMPNFVFGQIPNLGEATSFALFTAAGAFNNLGNTSIVGDIGTDVGAFSGFPPGIVVGEIHVADATSAQAATDVDVAYSYLSSLTCGMVIGTTLGNNQVLTPNIYCLGAASSLNGDLILDGEGDPNAIFIFKINGALSTSTFSNVVLLNSASLCNVYWQVNGAFALGDGSVFRGTLLVNGAISLLEGSSLLGRALSRAGAISLHNNVVTIGMEPLAPTITANGSTLLCEGQSVILSGNISGTWSRGATTPTISVNTSGNYFVTVSNGCGTDESNHIIVTVNPLPLAIVGPNSTICNSNSNGNSVMLGVAPISGHTYLWTPAIGLSSSTIANPLANPFVTTIYTLTETITATACQNTHSVTVTVIPFPNCIISGNSTICQGQSSQLCATTGSANYLWSTGSSSNCIIINTAGTYSITVTNFNGCSSVCSRTVSYSPSCLITGNGIICQGSSTLLSVPTGSGNTYLWSTGSTNSNIIVSQGGNYSVTVTNGTCSNVCTKLVTVNALPACTITGNTILCEGQTVQLCASSGAASYSWSTGAKTNCITVSTGGKFFVTVTAANGCKSTCSKTIILKPNPNCVITGNLHPWKGKSTTLCATPGLVAYKWSTGSTICCITVNTSGTYVVTTTNANGCTSTCSATVSYLSKGSTSRSGIEMDTISLENGNIDVHVYPNPFSTTAIMLFQNTLASSKITIALYNVSGNKISTLFDGTVQKDVTYSVDLSSEKLMDGIYFYRIINGTQIINRKLILIK
ncbi:MAG: DUF3494 domain-containing protein [Saprospiraceae bacterium]|nr:DUF3494 domain-containing protein [Saprospiraceae bacterium]